MTSLPAQHTQVLPTSDGHHTRADLRMLIQAVSEGWDIKPEWKKLLPTRIAQIVADPKTKPREAIAAVMALRTMDRDNFDKLLAVYEAQTARDNPAASTSNTVNLNVGVGVNVQQTVGIPDQLAKLAMDPEKFREFARLAVSLQEPAKPAHANGTHNGTHSNGTHSNGTHNGQHT